MSIHEVIEKIKHIEEVTIKTLCSEPLKHGIIQESRIPIVLNDISLIAASSAPGGPPGVGLFVDIASEIYSEASLYLNDQKNYYINKDGTREYKNHLVDDVIDGFRDGKEALQEEFKEEAELLIDMM